MNKLIAAFVHRSVLGNLASFAVFALGLFSMFSLQREAFPNIDFDIVLVETVYPGASPGEVEKLVTIPLERELKGLDNIKSSSSTSLDSRSTVVLTLEPDLKDKLSTLQEIRDAVDSAEREFPSDVEDSAVMEISTSRSAIIEVAVSAKDSSVTELELREWADRLQDQTETINDVATVEMRGYRNREMFVDIIPERLFAYNVSADDVVAAIAARNINFPGGEVTDGGKEYALRTVKQFSTAPEIADLVVRSNDIGRSVTVGDVARVRDSFEEKNIVEKANGEEAIILTILKKEKGDAIHLVDEVLSVIHKLKQTKGAEKIEFTTMNDLSYFIRRRLSVLIGNVSVGMVLVAISLYLFLGWRVALMVAIGIPISFAATFLFMKLFGVSINLLSLFGLIIVSGMIVDDAIVIGENFYRHLEKGLSPVRAAIVGTTEMVAPVSAAVFTTIVAFAPLLMMGGIMGKFMWSLPAVVIIALLASLIESIFVLPSHLVDISPDKKKGEKPHESRFEARLYNFLLRFYRPVIEWSVPNRYTVIVITIGVVLLGFSLLPKIGFVLFPTNNIEMVFIKAEAVQGLSLSEMEKKISFFEHGVSVLPKEELTDYSARIGIQQESSADPFTKLGKNYGQVTLYLTPENTRARTAGEIILYLQKRLDPSNPVVFAGFSERDNLLYIMRRDRIMQAYSPDAPGRIAKSYVVDSDVWLKGVLLPGNNLVAAYTIANEFIVVDPTTGKIVQKKQYDLRRYDSPSFATFSPDASKGFLFTQLGDVFELTPQSLKRTQKGKFKEPVNSIVWDEKSENFYVASPAGTVTQFHKNFKKGFVIRHSLIRAEPPEKKGKQAFARLAPVTDVLVRGDKLLFTATDGFLREVSITQKKILKETKYSQEGLYSIIPARENRMYLGLINGLVSVGPEQLNSSQIISFSGTPQFFPDAEKAGILPGTHGLLLENRASLRVIQNGDRWLEKIEYRQAGGGPPVGAPVQFEIRGNDFEELRSVTREVKEILSGIEGVYDIRDNQEEGKQEYHVQINEARAAMAGVSVTQIASTIQTFFEGRVASSIKEAEEQIDIRVILPEDYRNSLDSLRQVKVRNNFGNLVPITELAWFEKKNGVSLITHSDFVRTIYIKANIDENRNSSVRVNTELMSKTKAIQEAHPNLTFKAGGEYQDTQDSMKDLGFSFLVAVFGILIILVLMFGNLRHPRVVMMAIPLGLVGVIFTFFIHKVFWIPNLTLSFLATFGIIGLAGVVVNDAIVLVDYINKLRSQGKSREQAVVEAGTTRLRAVLLTTITTVFGLLPTAYGIGGDDPFLKPMALTIAWGLAFATLITLIVIPVYYTIWEDRAYIFHRVITKHLREPEKD